MSELSAKSYALYKNHKSIIEFTLSDEGYIEMSPSTKDDPGYKIAHKMKEEIRNYKWYRGEEGKMLSWQDAVEIWQLLYLDDFFYYIENSISGDIILNNKVKCCCREPDYRKQAMLENKQFVDESHPLIYWGVGVFVVALLYYMIFIF